MILIKPLEKPNLDSQVFEKETLGKLAGSPWYYDLVFSLTAISGQGIRSSALSVMANLDMFNQSNKWIITAFYFYLSLSLSRSTLSPSLFQSIAYVSGAGDKNLSC